MNHSAPTIPNLRSLPASSLCLRVSVVHSLTCSHRRLRFLLRHTARTFAALLLFSLSLPFLSAAAASAPTQSTYRGFTFDESQVQNLPDLAAIRAASQVQIDMICAVGLPPDVVKFFQGVPFQLVPAGTFRTPTPGVYGNGVVKVSARIATFGHKPVLLHEYLHAYHDQRMPQRTKNPEVLAFYEKAKTLKAYAAQSHMMANQNEFFACSATTFLFGVTAQEPFKREKIKEHQPDLVAFLQKLFGPDTGTYAGSLTQ